MEVYTLSRQVSALRKTTITVGFVPTMGALHQGHISLIKASKDICDFTVCSIFVNPTQFNDPADLEKYPRTAEADLKMLRDIGCDAVFMPAPEEIYPPATVLQNYNFGALEQTMEGLHRPGHFNGMANVVQRLFSIVQPDKAFFGEKDFQQLLIVKSLVAQLQLPIQIVPCAIVREPDGLAMSSRNVFLNQEQRIQATGIFKTLLACSRYDKFDTPLDAVKFALEQLKNYPLLEVLYFTIVNECDLNPVEHFQNGQQYRMFVAVRIGNVRLIDNMRING